MYWDFFSAILQQSKACRFQKKKKNEKTSSTPKVRLHSTWGVFEEISHFWDIFGYFWENTLFSWVCNFGYRCYFFEQKSVFESHWSVFYEYLAIFFVSAALYLYTSINQILKLWKVKNNMSFWHDSKATKLVYNFCTLVYKMPLHDLSNKKRKIKKASVEQKLDSIQHGVFLKKFHTFGYFCENTLFSWVCNFGYRC